MKKFMYVLVIISCMFYYGCEGCQKMTKHFKSSAVGLDRIVTLYDCNGEVIKTYEGRFVVEIAGGTAALKSRQFGAAPRP